MGTKVNADNFVRAETARMLAGMQAMAGGVNRLGHNRTPTPLDAQTVIRMNRDTLYSFAVVDISEGARLTLPDPGGRYLSAMVVNEDHFINEVLRGPGVHELTVATYDTPYVLVAVRILVDPDDPADLEQVRALQDGVVVEAGAARPFEPGDWDTASLDATRDALLQLAKGYDGFERAFGRRGDVDPVRHLVGTAAGWGGLPETEAMYVNVAPDLAVGEYRMVFRDVPVDAFWSVSLYNAAGFFEPSDQGGVSVNSVTAVAGDDGAVTVHLGGCGDGRPNCLALMEGWNFVVRLYRPRPEILDGRWTAPPVEPVA
jgi:hypothetical protein